MFSFSLLNNLYEHRLCDAPESFRHFTVTLFLLMYSLSCIILKVVIIKGSSFVCDAEVCIKTLVYLKTSTDSEFCESGDLSILQSRTFTPGVKVKNSDYFKRSVRPSAKTLS